MKKSEKKNWIFFSWLLHMARVTREYPKYPNFGSGRVGSGPFHGQVLQVQNSEYPKERGKAGYQILQVFCTRYIQSREL